MVKFFVLIVILLVFFLSSHEKNDSIVASEDNNGRPSSVFKLNEEAGDKSIVAYLAYKLIGPMMESKINQWLSYNGFVDHLTNSPYDDSKIEYAIKKEGSGNQIYCGQVVSVKIAGNVTNSVNSAFDKQTIHNVRLGDRILPRALEMSIIGMKKSEIREVIIPSVLWVKDKYFENFDIINYDTSLTYFIEIQDVKKLPAFNNNSILHFDQALGVKSAAMCGDNVTMKYEVRNIKNEVTKSNIVEFNIGSCKVPLGLTFAAYKMQLGGKRAVILPNYLLQRSELFDHVLPKNETSILNVEISSLVKKDKK